MTTLCLKATRLLNQKAFENPKVKDLEGKLTTRPGDTLDIVSTYFKDKIVDNDQDVIPPLQGERNISRRGQKKL